MPKVQPEKATPANAPRSAGGAHFAIIAEGAGFGWVWKREKKNNNFLTEVKIQKTSIELSRAYYTLIHL